MTQPIKLNSKLAGNPTQAPRYSVTVKGPDGEAASLGDPRATRAMVALMDMNAVLGGAASHYGGPAAFAELMSALHGIVFQEAQKKSAPWHELYHLINDAGHCENGLYALKANYGFAGLSLNSLKGFRSIDSKLTGHGESHLFPEGVFLSNGPLGSAFPQSQGLAMADALAGKNRVTVTAISDGACMEGEAREALAAVPGLARSGKLAPYVLVISDNNTKLTGRIDQDAFSMEPTFATLPSLGWKVISLADGHDLQKCFDAITQAISEARANPKIPVAIHARTIKGIGTKKTAESSSGGHGFPLKSPTELKAFIQEIYHGENYPETFDQWIDELIVLEKEIKAKAAGSPKAPDEKIQAGVSAALVKTRKAGLPVVSITSDLPGSTGVAGFRKEFPADSFDVGVAESNMISVAAGFSKLGYIPVVDTFAQFGVTKGALPLIMANLSYAPMLCVFSHTGFQDAADGASHQALSYLAMTASLPNCDVYCLTCSEEADALVTQAIQKFADDRKAGRTPRTTVFFLGRENFPKTYQPGARYDLRKAQIVQDSSAQHAKCVCLVASGSLIPQALEAARELETQGIGAVVVNPGPHNHPDLETLTAALKRTSGRMVVVEDHQKIGGLFHLLAAELYLREGKTRALGVDGGYGQSAYNAIDLYEKHRMDAKAIASCAIEIAKTSVPLTVQ
ncbi:MAG: transketolase C-terminal domain-containing protein [Oligoflexia bacterium]|nr:transketolase C-terminal domain-containing protein [Oligoflexia bacterium]